MKEDTEASLKEYEPFSQLQTHKEGIHRDTHPSCHEVCSLSTSIGYLSVKYIATVQLLLCHFPLSLVKLAPLIYHRS